MEAEQHYGFEPDDVGAADGRVPASTLVEQATFQAGLNHLFVFERPPRTP